MPDGDRPADHPGRPVARVRDLERAYPQVGEFFRLKRERDPGLLFMNSLAARYGDELSR